MLSKNAFLVMWCNEGLECVIPVPTMSPDEAKMWEILGGEKQPDISSTVFGMEMRARANSQRHYEIYAITAADGIEKDDIVGMFDADSQYAADTMRRIGSKMYSDRATPNKIKIV
jgi:hypothetical protein